MLCVCRNVKFMQRPHGLQLDTIFLITFTGLSLEVSMIKCRNIKCVISFKVSSLSFYLDIV